MYCESLTFGEQVKRYRRRRCRHLLSRWWNRSRRNRWTRPFGELNVVYSNIAPPNTSHGFNLYLKKYQHPFSTLDFVINSVSLYLSFRSKLWPVKTVWAVPFQNVKKCEWDQGCITRLSILVQGTTNSWLLLGSVSSDRTLFIEFIDVYRSK